MTDLRTHLHAWNNESGTTICQRCNYSLNDRYGDLATADMMASERCEDGGDYVCDECADSGIIVELPDHPISWGEIEDYASICEACDGGTV